MKVTLPYLQEKFTYCNQRYFSGKLPALPIEIKDVRTYLGMCIYRRVVKVGQKKDFRLRFSSIYDLSEQEWEDIMIHEMIHYHIGYNGLKDNAPHGRLFKQEAFLINRQYNRHISITHRKSEGQAEDTTHRVHVVALMHLTEGIYALKVLPRNAETIRHYYTVMKQAKGIESIELYVSDSIYFNKYPSSGALKMYKVDEKEVRQHLATAQTLPFNLTDKNGKK